MNVALRTAMTVEQFLAWEERQEQRHEFDGFKPVAMAGATAEHSAIQRNLVIALAEFYVGVTLDAPEDMPA